MDNRLVESWLTKLLFDECLREAMAPRLYHVTMKTNLDGFWTVLEAKFGELFFIYVTYGNMGFLLSTGMEGVMQFYVNVEKEEGKFDKLCDLYDTLCITSQSVILVNTRLKAEWLTQKMRSKAHIVSAIHGDMDQFNRDRIMREFHSGTCPVLITSTDMMASTINAEQVSLAINYDLPTQPEQYRRIETFGRTGVAINFVTRDEKRVLHDIERVCNMDIRELPFSTS